jgi:hypothetical protein
MGVGLIMLGLTGRKHNSNRGFTLVIALGVGLITMVTSVTLLVRSQSSENMASAQKATSQGLGIAETAITRYTALINQYPNLALYCATPNSSDSSCNSGTTWSNVTDSVVNSKSTGTTNFCTGTTTTTTTSTAVTEIQNIANSNYWQQVDNSKLSEGKFRLISYTYTPDSGVANTAPGQGKLVVEGEIKGGVSRLAVTIPVFKSGSSGSSAGVPGLWISNNGDSSASGGSGDVIFANIKDSSCTQSKNVDILKDYLDPNYTYSSTPGEAFPPLPPEGLIVPTSAIKDMTKVTNSTGTLPRTTDTPVGDVYTYHFTDTGKSVDLSGGSNLTVNAPGKTVVFYVEGSMVLSGGSAIQVTSGTELIVYAKGAKGDLTLSGGSTNGPIQNSGATDMVEIYVYNPGKVVLSGGSGMNLFLFAPKALVEETGGSTVNGTIWSESWKSSGGSKINQSSLDLSKTKLGNLAKDKIGIQTTTSWERLPSQ